MSGESLEKKKSSSVRSFKKLQKIILFPDLKQVCGVLFCFNQVFLTNRRVYTIFLLSMSFYFISTSCVFFEACVRSPQM
jgi:hypothetical protein